MSKPDGFKDWPKADQKKWKKQRRKARRRARREWLAKAFDIMDPIADKAVEAAALAVGMPGEERHEYALNTAMLALDKALALPPPWEQLSDLGLMALRGAVAGAIERAYQKSEAKRQALIDAQEEPAR